MTDPLSSASRRMLRSSCVDGLPELVASICCLGPALCAYWKLSLDPHSASWRILNILQVLFVCPGAFALMWLVPRVRNRFFGERTGTMIPRMAPEGRSRTALALVGAAIGGAAISLLMGYTGMIQSENILVPVFCFVVGFGVAVYLLVVAEKSGVGRYRWMAGLVAVASIATAALVRDSEMAFVWLTGFVGALCLVTGFSALWKYAHTLPPDPDKVMP